MNKTAGFFFKNEPGVIWSHACETINHFFDNHCQLNDDIMKCHDKFLKRNKPYSVDDVYTAIDNSDGANVKLIEFLIAEDIGSYTYSGFSYCVNFNEIINKEINTRFICPEFRNELITKFIESLEECGISAESKFEEPPFEQMFKSFWPFR